METVSTLKPRSKYARIKKEIISSGKGYVIKGDTIYWLADDWGVKNAIVKLRHFTNRWGEKITAFGYGYEHFGKWYYQHNFDRNRKYVFLLAESLNMQITTDKNGWFYFNNK